MIWVSLLIVSTVPFTCRFPISLEEQHSKVLTLFLHGELATSQNQASAIAHRLDKSSLAWSTKFSLLEAESALWRGRSEDALKALPHNSISASTPSFLVQSLAISGLAHSHLHQFDTAAQELSQAQSICKRTEVDTCGEMLRARGGLAAERGMYQDADALFQQSLDFARRWRQTWDESVAMMNLGGDSVSEEHLDDAVDELTKADHLAVQLNAGDIQVNTEGNLGWTYFNLGDSETSLELLEHAAHKAANLGDADGEATWLTLAGIVYKSEGSFSSATSSYQQAYKDAIEIKSFEGQLTSLEYLADIEIEVQNWSQAKEFIDRTQRILNSDASHLDALQITLEQAKIDAAQNQEQQAQALFQSVQDDPQSQPSMRLEAEHELAKLYESEHQNIKAEQSFAIALNTFEASRNQLRQENSRLPFLNLAASLYDDYIHFLIERNQPEKALLIADQSRARTLSDGLGLNLSENSANKLHPQAIARKAGATLLFYWLGKNQSFLWAITANQTTLLSLPPKSEIARQILHYRKSLQGPEDPLHSSDKTALSLYNILIAPAGNLIRSDKPVMILADGELSQLNFETLLAPATNPKSPHPHYWIEDVTVESAPSLSMLTAAKPSQITNSNLLMIGNPRSVDASYPELPNALEEMTLIHKHFSTTNISIFAQQQATPSTYFTSKPERYAYIHFVAHGVASRTDPLDSAIILSQTIGAQSSFKLHAREIMQHPIDARLVTLSACYGTGTRAYAGEGLVGLSWAFLRAGAHNTIGAMWEASDESTPLLMDSLYQGLQHDQPPAVALRNAKLKLLHSNSVYRKPFYWAPFQLYTRL